MDCFEDACNTSPIASTSTGSSDVTAAPCLRRSGLTATKKKKKKEKRSLCGCCCLCGLAALSSMPVVLSTPTADGQEEQPEEALWESLMAASASSASQTTTLATETRHAGLDRLSSSSEFSRSLDPSTVARRRRKGALLRRDDEDDDDDDDDQYHNFNSPDDIPKQLLSIAPSGWADRKHSSDFYAGPVIIAASVVLAVAIIVTLCLIVCFMRRRSTKVQEAEASDTERASLDQEKLDTDHQELQAAAALASEKGSLGKKKGGVLRVTKQRITTVRRRRQARKAPPQATTAGSLTPSETASPAPEPQEPINSSEAQSSAVDLHPAQSRQQPHQQEDSEEQTGSSGPSPPDSSDSLPVDHSQAQQSTQAVAMPSSPPPPPPPPAAESSAAQPSSQRPPDPPAYDHPLSARQREKRPAAATEDTEEDTLTPTSSSAAAALALQESLPAPRPDYDLAEYAGHVATDDKAVLAHRNQLASAPSASNSDQRAAASTDELPPASQSDLGESAPHVDVDEEGFEIHPDSSGMAQPSPALPAPPTARPSAFALPSAPFDRPAPEAAGTLPPSSPDFGGSTEASAPDFGLGDAHHDARPQAEPSAPHLPWMPLPTYEAEESSAPPLPLEEGEADHAIDAEHHHDVGLAELPRPELRSRTPSHSSTQHAHHSSSSNRQAGIDV